MRQLEVFLFVLLASASFVSAASVSADKQVYNLGDAISTSYSFVPAATANALLKLSVVCEAYNLPFFIYPLSLKPGNAVDVDIPNFDVSEHMIGDCYLDAVVESIDGALFERAASPSFVVSSAFNISAKLSEGQILPGRDMIVYGSVAPSYGTFSGDLLIGVDSLKKVNLTDNNFVYSLAVPSNFASGNQVIRILANDSFGNSAELSLPFSVLPVATRLVNNINAALFDPGQMLRVYVSLLDQSGRVMDADVNLQVISPAKTVLFDSAVDTGQVSEITLDGQAMPGAYRVKSSYAGLKAESSFSVSTAERLGSILDSRNIRLTNVGNVFYDNTVNIVFKGAETLSASKHVSLDVGESVLVDLFKEVPSGLYDVEVWKGSGLIASYKDVSITDERNVVEKVVEKITGKSAEKVAEGEVQQNEGLSAVTSYVAVEKNMGSTSVLWGAALVVVLVAAVLLVMRARKKRENRKGGDALQKVYEQSVAGSSGSQQQESSEKQKPSKGL